MQRSGDNESSFFEMRPSELIELIKNRLVVVEASYLELNSVRFYQDVTIMSESYSSKYSRSHRKSYVLIIDEERTQFLLGKAASARRSMAAAPARRSNQCLSFVDENEMILHPAQVIRYLEVEYQVHGSCHTSIFALVQFYLPSDARKSWVFGDVYELWRPDFDRPVDYSSFHLVCISHLVGRFIPGIFATYFGDRKIAHPLNKKDGFNNDMVVLRVNLKNVF